MKCCTAPIGEMRSLVSLQRRGGVSDGYGGSTTTWTEYAKVWAQMRAVSGSEVLRSQQLENPFTHKVFIRYRADVRPTDRLVYGTRVFNIRTISDVEERKRFLSLVIEEGVA